ncbi:hypothetical protein [Mycolicibacterium porcinum]|uniref:hypothetical protein n=1 Tax=Mycolicibacterium porcinum TaxID=39693 RepID=UPI001041EB8B|nr:hypothetical protein [Mycolicibacterium porcinum]
MPDLRTHRHHVAQWTTGTTGTHALCSAVEYRHAKLSAVHVFGADRIGAAAPGIRSTLSRLKIVAPTGT